MSTPAEELDLLLHQTFPLPDNEAALQWLCGCTSAHGDLVERLAEVVRPLPLTMWAPDGDFPFFVVYDDHGLVRGAAVGMTSIYVRVPRNLASDAAKEGERVVESGPGWYRFEAFDVASTLGEQIGRLRRWFAALDG